MEVSIVYLIIYGFIFYALFWFIPGMVAYDIAYSRRINMSRAFFSVTILMPIAGIIWAACAKNKYLKWGKEEISKADYGTLRDARPYISPDLRDFAEEATNKIIEKKRITLR